MINTNKHLDIAMKRDGELGILPPCRQLVSHLVRASGHDLCRKLMPQYADMTEKELFAYIEKIPHGRNLSSIDKCPIYWFWIVLFDANGNPEHVVGDMNVNIAPPPVGEASDVCHYGYHVLPQYRGRHYAARAVRLAFPLLRAHGMKEAWITCHPTNIASRRTCEIVGGRLVDIVDVDESKPGAFDADRLCRYVLSIEE